VTPETQAPGSLKVPERTCSHPGCRARDNFATFKSEDGRNWCISHAPDQTAKRLATVKGAIASRRPYALGPDEPAPDFQTKESIVAWAEDTADLVLKAKLDPRLADSARNLALLALAAHDLANRDLLDTVRKLVPVRARRL